MSKIKRAQIFSDVFIVIFVILGIILFAVNFIPETGYGASAIIRFVLDAVYTFPAVIVSFMIGYIDFVTYNRKVFLILCPAVTALICFSLAVSFGSALSESICSIMALLLAVKVDELLKEQKKARQALSDDKEEKDIVNTIFKKESSRVKYLSYSLIIVVILSTVVFLLAENSENIGTVMRGILMVIFYTLHALTAIVLSGIIGYVNDAENPQENNARWYSIAVAVLCFFAILFTTVTSAVIITAILSLFLIVTVTEMLEERKELYQALQEKNNE